MQAGGTGDGTRRAGRARVTRDLALQAAVVLADRDGLTSVSMRKLARELGIEAMSLYHHVKNKEDLLDGMVDLVFSEITLPVAGEDWRSILRNRAESTRTMLIRHPWAISVIDSRTTPGPATLRHHDAAIGLLRSAGFSIPMAAHALSLLDSYVHGFVLQEVSLPLDGTGDIGAATEGILHQHHMLSGAFPHLAQMAVQHILQPGYAYSNEFPFGLRIILGGLQAALLETGEPASHALTTDSSEPLGRITS
jgi:AcrR family transcriptional regulator